MLARGAYESVARSDLVKFVDEKVRSEQSDSPEGVVRGALTLPKAQDARLAADVAELRKTVANGIAQAGRGELAPLDMQEVKRRAEALRAERMLS